MQELYLVEGARTPFGTYMGELKVVSSATLAITAGREALIQGRQATTE